MRTVYRYLLIATITIAAFVIILGDLLAINYLLSDRSTSQISRDPFGEVSLARCMSRVGDLGFSFDKSKNDERATPGGATPTGRFGFGQVIDIEKDANRKVILTIDPELIFHYENAELAAREDSRPVGMDGYMPFFIRNNNHNTLKYPLLPSAMVLIETEAIPSTTTKGYCGLYYLSPLEYYNRVYEQLKRKGGDLPHIYFDVDAEAISLISEVGL